MVAKIGFPDAKNIATPNFREVGQDLWEHVIYITAMAARIEKRKSVATVT